MSIDTAPAATVRAPRAMTGWRLVFDLFKLRIGIAIGATALAGVAIAPGAIDAWRVIAVVLAVTLASAAAGAFNQYVERDLDRSMRRTRNRAFATGRLTAGPVWPLTIGAVFFAGVGLAWLAANPMAALHTALGAFTYGVVYTVWLKRRTAWNIVIGGAAGSFAVLAGAAAVDGGVPDATTIAFAVVLFLWTPPHFWSLAAAKGQDYAKAGIPMLPVVVPAHAWTSAILAHSVALAVVSLVPLWFGEGVLYGLGAGIGGGYFVWKSVVLYRAPSKENAMANFFASLLQLALLIAGALLSSAVRHWL